MIKMNVKCRDKRSDHRLNHPILAALVVGLVLPCLTAQSAEPAGGYYKVTPQFIPYPEPGKPWTIKNIGPVGIGITLGSPAFTMTISNVAKGSPAEATGKLVKGQVIESINGQVLKDIDPREQLANILTEAEATDGLMKLRIKDLGEVVVTLPVLGRYSSTWPLDCPKSARIVRNFGDWAARLEKPDWSAAPFLMSTGEEKDLETLRKWIRAGIPEMTYPWHIGYRGTAICEYYLRTGDESVMPAINKMSAKLKASMYNGSWMGRGSEEPNFKYMAGGHMNAAGVHAFNFLMLAKQCGAEVDEYMLQQVLKQFFRFAGRGNVAYGDQLPEGGFRDNGKTAGLAVALSSAAGLDPKGERSLYAYARDNSAMKSFYATTWFNRGHTGGGIGEIWHGVAVQLLADKKPLQYRSFMDARRWFYELSRRHDGSFGIDDGGRYDNTEWGNSFAMAYTAPRKKLRMFGAPPTRWSKTHPLPERPWGNRMDDIFQSNKPSPYLPGKVQAVANEVLPDDASGPIMARFTADAPDELFLMYAHHPDFGLRSATARTIVNQGRTHLIMPLLQSRDPRVRDAGVLTLAGMFKGKPLALEAVTEPMWARIGEMINDPDESWWVAMNAMKALARAPQERIIPHVDRLLEFVNVDDWWVQSSVLEPLSKVATDERVYRKVLPAITWLAVHNTAHSTLGATKDLPKQLATAKPEVQQLAIKAFSMALERMPDPLMAPGGANLATATRIFKDTVQGWLKPLPK